MNTNPTALVVQAPAPPAAATNDIRGLKDALAIPGEWTWLWWTLGALVLAAGLYWLWRRWQKKAAEPASVPFVSPADRARRKLEAAKVLVSEPERYCVAVSNTLRIYLEEQFNLHAPDRTTEEFLVELQSAPWLTVEQKGRLADFLSRCDLVKFARYEPTLLELEGLLEAAMHLVNETEPPPLQPQPSTAQLAKS